MTDVVTVMNLQHIESDPADIRIRIWINPEIGIRIPNQLRLEVLVEVCALCALTIYCLNLLSMYQVLCVL